MRILGMAKIAENESEVIQPEEKEVSTRVTCISDCKYSQNPERTCMLETVSLSMGKEGMFGCGQYSQVVPEMDPDANDGQVQANNQLGLAGAKKENK